MKFLYSLCLTFILFYVNSSAQSLPSSIVMKNIAGGTFTMGSNTLTGSPSQQAAAPEHQVTLSAYSMSEAEITNSQYVEFLNAAYNDGLIQIVTGTAGPDSGKRLIQGTASSSYNGKNLYGLDGTRVMKDHNDWDGDGNPFTGVIEPEHPLNIAYIDFNSSSGQFYVKNPLDTADFMWDALCDYYDYGAVQGTFDTNLKNDFDDWAGAGQNFSNELQGWTAANPAAATNMPTQADVSAWPVNFVRWWGAKAFADYYGYDLPTDAQWEYAAKGGSNYLYSVHDGADLTDANWNQIADTVAKGHVRAAISGTANPFGIYNMGGNVWEWVADNYTAPLSTAAVTDPYITVALSDTFCWRGGSWNYHQNTLQSAFRYYDTENKGNDHFGFRIAGASTSSLHQIQEDKSFEVYPNPSMDYIVIQPVEEKAYLLEIYSIEGRLLRTQKIFGRTTISIHELPKGLYLLKLGAAVQKLRVE